ncbi:MAG: phosphodiester glycosidase family protein [Ignavibacteriales bacterium]|nr:phosphodiester glycosidase family protein [Ignavibacteriales bacterium]
MFKFNLKLLFLLSSIFCFQYNIFAQDSTIVGPGVIYYHDQIIEGGPWNFDILKIDLKNPFLKLESVKAKDNLFSFETMSSASKRYDKEGHKIVGAINGDFYNTATGEPTNIQIIDGQLIYKPINRVAFAMDEFKHPLLETFNYSASLLVTKDSSVSIANLNQLFESGKATLYNSFFGSSTHSPKGTNEITIQPINGWVVNDTMECIVTKADTNGNSSIQKTYSVISGSGQAGKYLAKANVGDTLKLIILIKPALYKLMQAVGGNVKLVTNGIPNSENGDRHPRTAVGFSKDSLTIYFITVDGRQPGWSVGMSYYELGKYMKDKWNVYQGINLDGGGSTTMVVRGALKNKPSDGGGERTVANGVFIVSTAPTGPLAHVVISPKKVFVIKGGNIKFSASAYDEYYNPLSTSGSSITWSCDHQLGSIDATGNLSTTDSSANGYVFVQLNSIKDSVLVHISSITKIILTPDPVVLQIGQVQEMLPSAFDSYGNSVQISKANYEWTLTGDIGTITNSGIFTAEKTGEGKIIAKYEEAADTVDVKIGVEQYFILDDFSGARTYTISGTKINLSECSFSFDNSKYVSVPMSGKLEYSLATGGTTNLNLGCDIPISGTPEAIGINVYGDGKGHWLRCELKDKNNNKFLLDLTSATPGIDWTDRWEYLEVPLDKAIPSWANPSATLTFPISVLRIYLAETSDLKKDKGTLFFDDLKVHFISTDVKGDKDNLLPEKFGLKQNYPNPFNPNTIIEYSVPQYAEVELAVYDILGKKVESLIKKEHSPGIYKIEWDASKHSSGVYLYKLIAGDLSFSKKMQLVK